VISAALIAVSGLLLARIWKLRIYHEHMLVYIVPNRALLAARLVAKAKRHGVDVKLSSRPYGALDAIHLVDQPNDIDMALIPGGVALHSYPNARQVAALGLEPLHLLVRAELAEGGLRGEGLMSGIVSLVNDTRNSLERIAPAVQSDHTTD
jgi:hypothetical protein